MVNSVFILFAAFAADVRKGPEAPFDLRDLFPEFASRCQSRDQIGPAKPAEIRDFALVGQIGPLELPLDHSPGDNGTW